MSGQHTQGELEEAVRAGWNACLRNLFSLCEQTADEASARTEKDFSSLGNEARAFLRGRAFEAKGIARAMNSFGPEHGDDLAAYFAKAQQGGSSLTAQQLIDSHRMGDHALSSDAENTRSTT